MITSGGLMFFHHNVPNSRRPILFPSLLAMVLSCLCITGASTQDGKITCTAPSVRPLQEAVLVCNFPEDLSATKKDFTVYHYANNVSPDAIIDCWWLNNKLDCYAQPDFQYSKAVGNNLTVTIQQVTTKLTGTYACQVAGYGRSLLETCEIKFDIGSRDNCNIVHSGYESQANVTCLFNEDISKTKKQFGVYKHNGQDKEIVANCSWEETRPRCQMGYLDSNDVSYYTTLRISHVAQGTWDNYSCWHEGSISGQQETCHLYVDDNEKRVANSDKTDNTMAIVLGSLISTLLLAAGIVLMIICKGRIPFLRRCIVQQNGQADDAEDPLMPTPDDTTVRFMNSLINDVKEMYPDIMDSCHFVPPFYFNKTQYKLHSVSGRDVYIPVIPDIKNSQDMSVLRHDRAMQHVLHCLHHMADQRQEKMFVLTQFKYTDYLNNPGSEFQKHGLPVPSGVVDEEEDVACVDFVIVHREHGVLVGVVKAVSDKVEDSDDGQQDEGGCIVTAVSEAVQQLQKANRVIGHVMSDQRHKANGVIGHVMSGQQHFPTVRHTLILPNLPRDSLCRAVTKHTDLLEKMRECLDVTATEDPTTQCLCVEDLSDPSTPSVVNTLRDRWKWTCARVDDVVWTDDLYLTVIARFCGPATQSTLDIQEQPYLLPKTLAEAVSLTGDLYERWTLHPHMVEMLNEQRLFLVGSPSVDKMRMLALAGKMWLSQGHHVYILSDSPEPRDSVMSMLWNTLKTKCGPDEADDPSRFHLSVVQCDLKNKNEVEKTLKKLNLTEGSSPCVIVQDAVINGSHFRSFCETLRGRCPDVYLWATSNTNKNVPEGWTMKTFIQTLTCPPAVVREVSTEAVSQVTPGGEGKLTCLPPSDGPPVKYFKHVKTGPWTVHECKDCSKEVADFLIKHLFRTKITVSPAHDNRSPNTQTTPGDQTLKTASIIQKKDVLVLFESEADRMYQFLIGLNDCGIAVSSLQYVNGKYKFRGQPDALRAMHVDELQKYPVRKKVVVYVEKHRSAGDVSKKQLVISTCTSQLIVIRGNP
ncbi:uncharacterized protein LOC112574756 [Pomacea canaliculata]|uniref:uncharacterized protein LOC112574756 n=1 Tax=Pomacea canaliculata TaxID=400727 RepID=UPI000D7258A6|nr:uncharacterized protein LOC112574756 [Pomacea canaliculata]XP_025111785.1 uncharacterized protein LOC112574756 [Pomacea canaliculata]